ncbi:MAG: hypothetical protein OEY33_06030 [Bdellovibrionales bacterium]|jgi:phage FluMu gp28-like protein|nr:hypothetical protein [Bdellovibrionales bacterium]
MVSSIFYIEYLLLGLVLIIAFKSYIQWSHEQEEKFKSQMAKAKEEYDDSLEHYASHPNSSNAKEFCLAKGEIYYQYKLPDYFNYPLGDTTPHVEYMDNHEQRKKLIEDDMKTVLKSLSKHQTKAA